MDVVLRGFTLGERKVQAKIQALVPRHSEFILLAEIRSRNGDRRQTGVFEIELLVGEIESHPGGDLPLATNTKPGFDTVGQDKVDLVPPVRSGKGIGGQN